MPATASYVSYAPARSATCEACAVEMGALVPVEHAPQPEAPAGLYRKYTVERTDGSSRTGGKHEHCDYFILDWIHDKYAVPAMQAYAKACQAEYPALAEDIRVRCLATAFANTPPRTEPLPDEPSSDAGQVHVNDTLTDACNARWNTTATSEPAKAESKCHHYFGQRLCEVCGMRWYSEEPPRPPVVGHPVVRAAEPAKAPLSEAEELRELLRAEEKRVSDAWAAYHSKVADLEAQLEVGELKLAAERDSVSGCAVRLAEAAKSRDEFRDKAAWWMRECAEAEKEHRRQIDREMTAHAVTAARVVELSKPRDEAVLAERARVNGWWMAWLDSDSSISWRERNEGIESGAPAPGGGK